MIASDMVASVSAALHEDVRTGDITAALIPENVRADARIICREHAILCGKAWVNEVYRQLDSSIQIQWNVNDGDRVRPEQPLCWLSGMARSMLTGERCALNFLQTLSATATLTKRYCEHLIGTKAVLLDTRKTIPGLRQAQKYAVKSAGGENHRMGLYDSFLIKENHIMACGSIGQAVKAAKLMQPDTTVEVEIEDVNELDDVILAGADIVMLDNFELSEIRQVVEKAKGKIKIEVSGNVQLSDIREIAECGVDFISVGAITKNVKAIDLSMRFF